jgi:DNA-directed RNA polymerase subunit M/transcription elongation factor TFIIS
MMLPSEDAGQKVLKCNLCGHIKTIDDNVKEAYTFKTEIKHPKGDEFKNAKKEKKWRKKLKNKKLS